MPSSVTAVPFNRLVSSAPLGEFENKIILQLAVTSVNLASCAPTIVIPLT